MLVVETLVEADLLSSSCVNSLQLSLVLIMVHTSSDMNAMSNIMPFFLTVIVHNHFTLEESEDL